jgi:hypothetical protein
MMMPAKPERRGGPTSPETGENETNEKVEKHETGEKNEAEHREVAERHFKVTDIQHVSDTCSQAAVK